MAFHSQNFNQLTNHTLFNIIRSRVDVFVVEQNCAYPELDDQDIDINTQHIYWLEEGKIGAYARCYDKNVSYSAIGRVLVCEPFRNKGLARKLVLQAIECCQKQWPDKDIYIGAQTYLIDFYKSFGFTVTGNDYLEDGIPHQDMILNMK
ncbi:GNAT family N-acetyltransferase [Pseudoalteromonas sp. MMG010]|uniref:GNAT family N-acetyltransferase n=1 Tax=Pseudoalteromonas sp. MMG010 TaxID=2822685 RepID=UPI001B39CF7B|nr:GNAT family N-acetyltransferase [Pseudoalteromonas sp. MMG010]MBQ4831726.1 GNAT family N-acetyltransferase [Pseudoalteromonas sp. MMG010]